MELKAKTSKYKGVCWNKSHNKWSATICIKGKHKSIGFYDNEDDAHGAWIKVKEKYRPTTHIVNLDGEKWKQSLSLGETYYISNKGRVKNLDYHRTGNEALMALKINSKGYLALCRKGRLIHRLIAEAFIPNPYNKTDVNHKDGDITNIDINNLEWTTRRENISHGFLRNKSFIGAHYNKSSGKWSSQIHILGEQIPLGYFNTEIEAHERYVLALDKYGIENKYKKRTETQHIYNNINK